MGNPFVKKEDLESVQYILKVVNTTTSTDVGEQKQIEIVEFSRSSITLKVPKNSCAEGHSLMILMVTADKVDDLAKSLAENERQGTMFITGKVDNLERTGNKAVTIRVKLVQYIDEEWRRVLGLYADRQKYIDQSIKNYNS